MRVDQIEIHTGAVDFSYEPVRALEVKCEATTAFQKAPTMEDANLKLQQLAATVGANAVINVAYNSGVSLTSWKSMKATGLAVKRASEDMACPVCAETIKRAAQKCRFCGTDLGSSAMPTLASQSPATSRTSAARQPWVREEQPSHALRPLPPPLKTNDNPQVFLWIVVAVVVLSIIAAVAS